MARLIVVSNRVCPELGANGEAGGLAVGLKSVLEARGGVWVGWSGQVRERSHSDCAVAGHGPKPSHGLTRATLDLTEREHAGYYLGFANQVLWPALHGRTDLIRFQAEDYAIYRAVNGLFAQTVERHLRPGDVIWVHDYHLMPLGRSLRSRGIRAPMGFFLHVPFPSADAMSAVPGHKELVESLLAYDLIGFQSHNDLANFSDYVARHLDGGVAEDGTVRVQCRVSDAGVFPIGIDTAAFRNLAASPEVSRLSHRFEPCFQDRYTILGVDRLDYSKGLPLRLRAFERLIERYPEYRRHALMMQVAAPSREAIADYERLKLELEGLVGAINGKYGEVNWTPIHFVNRTLSHSQLAALYRLARVGMVTPLRDGMNLVAKEYVAAQDPIDPGVLVLSCFAGAAEQLDSSLIVNPHDPDGMARTLRHAIVMPLEERRARWTQAMASIESHDIHDWCRYFLTRLAGNESLQPRTWRLREDHSPGPRSAAQAAA